MQEEDIFYTDNFSEIPEIFYNSRTNKPHQQCHSCKQDLLEDDTYYFIEKAFKENETIFDYAVCIDCRDKMASDMISKESQADLIAFFQARIDLERRANHFAKKNKTDLDQWLKYCLLTGKPIADCQEYQVYAQCEGSTLPYVIMPYAISDEGIEEIMQILSKETKDSLHDFMEQLSPTPFLKKSFDYDRVPVLL